MNNPFLENNSRLLYFSFLQLFNVLEMFDFLNSR